MKQIYISHTREDEATACALSTALEHAGHTVWRHKRTHIDGWRLATAKTHLADADDVIAIWSKSSIRNPDVCEVAQEGYTSGRLTSALAEYVQPPIGLGVAKAIDLTDWEGEPTAAATLRLADLFPAKREPVAEPIPAPAPTPRKKRRASRTLLPVWPFALTAATCLAAIGVAVV